MTRGNTRPLPPTLPRRAPPPSFPLTPGLRCRCLAVCPLPTTHSSHSSHPANPLRRSLPASHTQSFLACSITHSPVLPRHLGRLTLSLTSLTRPSYPITRSSLTGSSAHPRTLSSHTPCLSCPPPRPPPRRPSREGTCPRQPPDRAPCLPSGRIASPSDPPPQCPVGLSGLAWRPPVRAFPLTEVLVLGAGEASYWTGGPAETPSSKHGSGSRDVVRSMSPFPCLR